jgi:hypothetical protein
MGKDTWEQHPANLIPPLTTKHASALSVDGTPSLARCRDNTLLLLIDLCHTTLLTDLDL